jgi:hypothetical protein
VTSTGDVGIGKTTPTVKLDVVGTINASTGFNGTVGATTPNTGAFTTLSSTGNTTLGDAAGDTITVNGATTFANVNPTLSAGTANGVTYLNGSKVLTSGSALTFDGTTLIAPQVRISAGGFLLDGGGNVFLNPVSGGSLSLTSNNSFTNGNIVYNANAASGLQVWQINSAEQMRLTSTGLGIGTSSPGVKLDILDGETTVLRVQGSGGTQANRVAELSLLSVGNFTWRVRGTNDSMRFLGDGNERMRITSAGNVGIGTTPAAKLHVLSSVAEVIRLERTATDVWRFSLSAGAFLISDLTADTERMRIDSAGNVGIGTTSPVYRLDVRTALTGTAAGDNTAIALNSQASGRDANIRFGDNVNATARIGYLSGALYVFTNNAERLRVTTTGNVGIGTSAPSAKLELSDATAPVYVIQTRGSLQTILGPVGSNVGDPGQVGTVSNSPFRLVTNNTERMRITSAGNVGIGTSSPGQNLSVVSSGATEVRSETTATDGSALFSLKNDNSIPWLLTTRGDTNDSFLIRRNGVNLVNLDTAGNLGLGVTPSAWGSGQRFIDVNLFASFGQFNNTGGAVVASNTYYNGTNWIYKNTNSATRFEARPQGQFEWFTAPSGTAGNAITFTQAMTLDASGRLGIGVTNPLYQLQVGNATTTSTLGVIPDATNGTALRWGGTGAGAGVLRFLGQSDAERMRIDSSGNVGIGTSSPGAKLDVRGSSTFLVNATNPTAWISVDSALTTGSMYNQWNTTSNLGISGTYTNHPYVFVTNNTERARIDTSGNFLFNSGYGSVATAYGCRAWVNFNGTGTVAIRASGNVSSITDNGGGNYTVNFKTAMPDANYTTITTTNRSSSNTALVNISRIADELASPTTSSVRVVQGVVDGSRNLQLEDCSFYCVAIFR